MEDSSANRDSPCSPPSSGQVQYLSEWPPPDEGPPASPDQERQKTKRLRTSVEDKVKVPSSPPPSLSEARVALASWCRRNPGILAEVRPSGPGSGLAGSLNAVRQTPAARDFLRDGLKSLESRLARTSSRDSDGRGRILHVMATYAYELEDFSAAMDLSAQATDSYTSHLPRPLHSLHHLEYLRVVESLSEEAREAVWFGRKAKLAADAVVEESPLQEQKGGVLRGVEVERVPAKDLPVAEFLSKYVSSGVPVVITGAAGASVGDGGLWDLDFISKHAGSKTAPLKRRERCSTEWARLEPVPQSPASAPLKVAEFIEDIRGKEEGGGRYLFDWSLPLHCPSLDAKFKIPEYFSHDYLKRTSEGSLYRSSWPSLFVGGPSVRSDLHVDAFASHFWMLLMHGKKRWTFFDRKDTRKLGPVYDSGLDPVFKVDPVEDKETVSRLGLSPRVVTLEAGELLFVPRGSPHAVENLCATVAVSGNFVDPSNAEEAALHLRDSALVDPGAADLLRQFVERGFVGSSSTAPR